MNNFTFGQSITQLSRQQLLPCPVSGTARPPARAPFSESHCGGRHRQSLIFNTFASGGSVAPWLGGLPETSPVGGKLPASRLHVASLLGVHANGLLFTCFPVGPTTIVSVCVCRVCVRCVWHACVLLLLEIACY